MKKRILLFCFCIFLHFKIVAQAIDSDSPEKNLVVAIENKDLNKAKTEAQKLFSLQEYKTKAEKEKIGILLKAANFFRSTDESSLATPYYNEVLDLYESDNTLATMDELDFLLSYYKDDYSYETIRIWRLKADKAEELFVVEKFEVFKSGAIFFFNSLNYPESRTYYERIEMDETIFLKNAVIRKSLWADYLYDYCILAQTSGDVQLLETLDQKFKAFVLAIGDDTHAQKYYQYKATYFENKYLTDSAEYYHKLVHEKIYKKKEKYPLDYLDYLDSQINISIQKGDYITTEKYIQEGIEHIKICEKIKNNEDWLWSFNEQVADYYFDTGNYGKSIVFYKNALKYVALLNSPLPVRYNYLKLALAHAYIKMNDTAKATPYIRQASAFFEATPEPTTAYASFCNFMGIYLYALDKKDSAIFYFEKGLTNYQQIEGSSGRNYLTNLLNLSKYYNYAGLYQNAYERAIKSYEGFSHLFYSNNPLITDCLYQLSWSLYKLHRNKESIDFAEKMILNIRHDIEHNLDHMTEQEKKEYLTGLNTYLNSYYLISLGQEDANQKAAEIYNLSLLTKGLILKSNLQLKNKVLQKKDPKLLTTYQDFKNTGALIGKFNNLSLEQRNGSSMKIDSLRKRSEQLEKNIRISLGNEQKTSAYIQTFDIQASLKVDEAAIEAIRISDPWTDKISYLIAVVTSSEKTPFLISLENGKDMEGRSLLNYLNSIKFKIKDENSYDTYFRKIHELLISKNINKIYFSPDGVYNQLSLPTIYIPSKKDYLCDELRMAQVYSTRIVVETKSTPFVFPEKAVIFGDPSFELNNNNTADTTRSFDMRGSSFNRLPGTYQEAKTIYEDLKSTSGKTVLITGKEATEKTIKAITDAGILHIATHGYFVSDKNATIVEAMMNSGLVMAGAADYLKYQKRTEGEDGLLTAYEISTIPFDSLKLVVLSACETGKGDMYAGEGVFGLQRAFIQSGAEYLLMSMWKVNDQATRDLMILFYKNLMATKDVHLSYDITLIELRKKYPEPYYWGSFVLIGKP